MKNASLYVVVSMTTRIMRMKETNRVRGLIGAFEWGLYHGKYFVIGSVVNLAWHTND